MEHHCPWKLRCPHQCLPIYLDVDPIDLVYLYLDIRPIYICIDRRGLSQSWETLVHTLGLTGAMTESTG